MTLAELQYSDQIRAAKWTHSEQQLVFSEVLGLSRLSKFSRPNHLLRMKKLSRLST